MGHATERSGWRVGRLPGLRGANGSTAAEGLAANPRYSREYASLSPRWPVSKRDPGHVGCGGRWRGPIV